ncbi:putative MFS multidrug transporter [Aspergillus candidus]|uniref:MFS general substrate transporter n=1 Tax=Aspergillus candidus TaxID=41067 RepID=A0A2I2FGB5_ASPCN|nr:MFS general substrate transporter [Aspergillus candidus]PLB39661.1 MFS general substrate transporter [Aspergillus candidus]
MSAPDTHNEHSPLLGTDHVSDPLASASRKRIVMIAASTLVLACDFGFYLTTAPQTEIFQDIICRNYMATLGKSSDTIPTEAICKSEPVQSELALVNGWKETSDVLPGILLAIPYGVAADRWGRKPVLLLGILGIMLGEIWVRVVCLYSTLLPLRLVWLSGMWRLIGGGDMALSSISLVMVADVFPREEMATALFRLSSAVILSEVLATPISAYLMARNPWPPFMLGLGVSILGSLSAFLIPETLTDARSKAVSATDPDEDATQTETTIAGKNSRRQYIKDKLRDLHKSTRFITDNPGVTICLFALFITSFSKQSTSLLLQYTSKRFHWSIGNSSLLISLRGLITLASFLLLMPAISSLLSKTLHLPNNIIDLRLSQVTSAVSALGLVTIATASSRAVLILGIVLLSLGAAFSVTCRSFVTTLVRPDHVGTLYSSAAAASSVGMVIAGPLLAYAFRVGLHWGESWFGLPFLMGGCFYALVSGAMMKVKAQ